MFEFFFAKAPYAINLKNVIRNLQTWSKRPDKDVTGIETLWESMRNICSYWNGIGTDKNEKIFKECLE